MSRRQFRPLPPSNRPATWANAGLVLVAALAVAALAGRRRTARRVGFDYSDRTGLPRGLNAARGAARGLKVPRDMRTPDALRPWATM